MPVCSFFLRGVCTRDNCPYLHVSVGPDAELCGEFIKGYCPLGENVRLRGGYYTHCFKHFYCTLTLFSVVACDQIEFKKFLK